MTGQPPPNNTHLLTALTQILIPDDGCPSAEDLADVLWMSRITPVSGLQAAPVQASAATPAQAGTTKPPLKTEPARDARTHAQDRSHQPPPCAANVPKVRLHPYDRAKNKTVGKDPAHVVQVSRPAFLPDPLHLNRALRPLRRLVAASGPPNLDEEATAQATSEAGHLVPIWRPATKPRFGIDLVVDTGSTMAVWHHLAAELSTLLERHGAFNDVRCWGMNTDTTTPTLVSYRRRTPHCRPPQHPSPHWHRPLHDPTNSRLLLVLTDGVGPAWHAHPLPDYLAREVTTRPTAALQVLPRRLWHRTALPTVTVEARITNPNRPVPVFRPNTTAPDSILSIHTATKPASRPWLPVMEVHGSWLAPWAEQLGGRRPDWVRMLATPLGNPPELPSEDTPRTTESAASERVSRFQSGSSPDAYRLACYLAAVPLSLPVMRIVQQALVPYSQQTDLAQLFVSGLITRREEQYAASDPDEVVYDFQPGVRGELLAELTRGESLQILEQVLAKVSGRVAATFGGTLDFRALASLVTEKGSAGSGRQLDPRSLPFAEVAVAVLSGAGGQHRSIAQLLQQAVQARLETVTRPHRPSSERRTQHQPGTLLLGRVLSAEADQFWLDVGDNDHAVLPESERSPDNELAAGDEIEVQVLEHQDSGDPLLVSQLQAQKTRAWLSLHSSHQEDRVVVGTVVDVVKGGLILDVGVRGFLPASLVEMRRIRDLQPYVGRRLETKIIELDETRNNVILSRRAWLEETQSKNRRARLAVLQAGQTLTGVVSSIVNFGAFVDLGDIDGLVHVSELSWKHVDHPSEVVELGQEVTVEVLDVDMDRERVSLSLKATQEDPWHQFARTHLIGQVVPAKVTKLVPFGAFVRVDEGIEGLVHISELASRRVEFPEQVVKVNDEIFVKVIDIELERRRISLSLKQADEFFGADPASVEFDPILYGMAASYDDEGNYIFPDGFDPETDKWLPGFEKQHEDWQRQYAEALQRFKKHRELVVKARLAEESEAGTLSLPEAMQLMRSRLAGDAD